MRIDAQQVAEYRLKYYDLCIVGSGPAGLTVANELKDSGMTLCVLESGGEKKSSAADRLRQLESTGVVVREQSRERILGGASTVWSGLSSPLDPIDFEQRPQMSVPGWPISRASLEEYYARAAEGYGFPSLNRMTTSYLAPVREKGDWRGEWENVEEKVFLASNPVRNFGSDFKDTFQRDTCDLFLDATVVRLETMPDSRRIVSALVRSNDGSFWRLQAKRYILAAGGIENARLLLNSTDVHPGLGSAYAQVGRYLMNHPKHYYGEITLTKPVRELPYYFGHTKDGFAGYAGLRLKESMQRQKGVLNSYVRFEPLYPWSDSPGIEAFVTLIKAMRPLVRAWLRFQKTSVVPLRDYSETGEGTLRGPQSFFDWIRLLSLTLRHAIPVSRYVLSRLMHGSSPYITKIRLRNFMEMEPRAENRVTLSEKKDAFGERLPRVVHECSELDKRSLIALHKVVGEEIAMLGLGRLESRLEEERVWPINRDASHHMGTTRMGLDPATSVVDADCKIHGFNNAYVAGTSVFATSGCANPTMTLVALAIRLADHLKASYYTEGVAARASIALSE